MKTNSRDAQKPIRRSKARGALGLREPPSLTMENPGGGRVDELKINMANTKCEKPNPSSEETQRKQAENYMGKKDGASVLLGTLQRSSEHEHVRG